MKAMSVPTENLGIIALGDSTDISPCTVVDIKEILPKLNVPWREWNYEPTAKGAPRYILRIHC